MSRLRHLLLWLEEAAFMVLVPGTVAYWLPKHGLHFFDEFMPSAWMSRHWLSLPLICVGAAIVIRCVWEFGARGLGVPMPIDHARHLVVSGLYRYVRNPMYLGVLLLLIGESIWFGSRSFAIYTLIWFACVHTFVLLYEEPNLRRRFGASYTNYTASVRRWVPKSRAL